MSYGIKLKVWGERACFTRPEMKSERMSYDVITPSAARGILEAIYWKPSIFWCIRKIWVLKPIRFETIRRNEIGDKLSFEAVREAVLAKNTNLVVKDICQDRQQRASTILRKVAYVIEADFVFQSQDNPDHNAAKHLDIFNRRARSGQYFHAPYFGVREFPVHFELNESQSPPTADRTLLGTRDLGWMLQDIDFNNHNTPHFFRPKMVDGCIEIPPLSFAASRFGVGQS